MTFFKLDWHFSSDLKHHGRCGWFLEASSLTIRDRFNDWIIKDSKYLLPWGIDD